MKPATPLIVLVLGLGLMGCFQRNLAAAADLHTESASCLREYRVEVMSAGCWENCVVCHPANMPLDALEIYLDGDAELCQRCHEGKTERAINNMLPGWVPGGGGNHPSGIYYDPVASRTQLKNDPQGPKLFYDASGNRPKLLCSTCHDPMGDTPHLLRINNRGSALCIACHDK